jgi:hypothetical protein
MQSLVLVAKLTVAILLYRKIANDAQIVVLSDSVWTFPYCTVWRRKHSVVSAGTGKPLS